MHLEIWQRVLKDKYFPNLSVISWLHSAEPSSLSRSQNWKNLLNALPLLVHWLVWKPGTGVSILIGKDEILRMGKGSFLSLDLISQLNEKHVYYLFQARRALNVGVTYASWLNSIELGLVVDLAIEWERYILLLIDAGISLTDAIDQLMWTGGDGSGYLTTMYVYNALVVELWQKNNGGVRRKLWNWECPQKIKLFSWLLIEDKLLTWNKLLK
jgi:hypothetical protein